MVYTQYINPDTRLGVWHLAEEEDFFLNSVKLESAITHPHKRLQHFAGRFLLKELFDDFPLGSIVISENRRPFLPGESFHFSISHCGDYAAAIVSRTHRVGVDIEIPQQKIERIKDKFISYSENEKLSVSLSGVDHLTIAWSIKEAVFKWYGLGNVDFKKHIVINNINHMENEISASVTFSADGVSRIVHVHGLNISENWLCWIASLNV